MVGIYTRKTEPLAIVFEAVNISNIEFYFLTNGMLTRTGSLILEETLDCYYCKIITPAGNKLNNLCPSLSFHFLCHNELKHCLSRKFCSKHKNSF